MGRRVELGGTHRSISGRLSRPRRRHVDPRPTAPPRHVPGQAVGDAQFELDPDRDGTVDLRALHLIEQLHRGLGLLASEVRWRVDRFDRAQRPTNDDVVVTVSNALVDLDPHVLLERRRRRG